MFPAALGIFMIILVQGLGMDPVLWGIVSFLPRLSDALTDPIMGYISDNTKSRWGRRRPYILIGAIIAGVSYIFMWQLDQNNSQMYNFTYFLGMSFVFYFGLTIFATPYLALGYEMSGDFHERTRLMAIAQWIGQWAWAVAPWFWVILYDPDIFPDPVTGARTLAVWVGITCLVMASVPAFFCKTEPIDPSTLDNLSLQNIGKNTAKLARGFMATFKCKPFVLICIATFCVFNAFNTVGAFSFFIIVHYMFGGDPAAAGTWPTWFVTCTSFAICFLAIPVVTWISGRYGKKAAFIWSQSISVFGYFTFWWCFDPSNPWLLFVPLPFFAFGIGALFTIMMSMTADVCDLDELNTGSRRAGVFGAVYWWMVKLGFAISALGGGLIMKMVGFDESLAQQTPEALLGMRLAYIITPVTGTVIAIIVMLKYDLTEERSLEIREELAERKKHSEASGQDPLGSESPDSPGYGDVAPAEVIAD